MVALGMAMAVAAEPASAAEPAAAVATGGAASVPSVTGAVALGALAAASPLRDRLRSPAGISLWDLNWARRGCSYIYIYTYIYTHTI